MHSLLKEKLWAYIVHHNPELMFELQEQYGVNAYLEEKVSQVMPLALRLLAEDKPGAVIHELCLNEMTRELRPSRFHYIKGILAKDFKPLYGRLVETGTLTLQTINMVHHFESVFTAFHFTEENKESQDLYYATVGSILEYLEQHDL